jgi:hypothetical protein
MQLRTISSKLTFWTKIVLPLLWSSIFGLVTLGFWLGLMRGKNNELPPEAMKYIFSAVWIVGTTVFLWLCSGLKRVRIDDKYLYVSNYLREIQIAFADIKEITENRWLNIHPVTIHLKNNSEFGNKIKFMPTSRFTFWVWSSHPVVAELKQLAGPQDGPPSN